MHHALLSSFPFGCRRVCFGKNLFEFARSKMRGNRFFRKAVLILENGAAGDPKAKKEKGGNRWIVLIVAAAAYFSHFNSLKDIDHCRVNACFC